MAMGIMVVGRCGRRDDRARNGVGSTDGPMGREAAAGGGSGLRVRGGRRVSSFGFCAMARFGR